MLKINSEFIEIGIGLNVPLCSIDLYSPEIKPNSENFHPADFEVTALMLNENMSIPSEDDFVYFGSRKIEYPDKGHLRPRSGDSSIYGSLWWMNTPGGDLEKEFLDDENLYWFPNKTKEEISIIKIHLSLADVNERFNNLNLGSFNNKCRFYIKIYQGEKFDEIATFDFTDDYSGFDTLELGYFKKINNHWFFEHSGLPSKGGLRYLINKYAAKFS